MSYPASEKLEIIRIVEQARLPTKQTLDRLGVARWTFYRWHDRYLEDGPKALEDRPSAPNGVWNRIPAHTHDQIIAAGSGTVRTEPEGNGCAVHQ